MLVPALWYYWQLCFMTENTNTLKIDCTKLNFILDIVSSIGYY